MGLDFLKKRAKKFQKGWDQERIELNRPTLFSQQTKSEEQTCAVTFVANEKPTEGEKLSVVRVGDAFVAARGVVKVGDLGKVDKKTAQIMKNSGNVALATVKKFNPLSGTGEVSIE